MFSLSRSTPSCLVFGAVCSGTALTACAAALGAAGSSPQTAFQPAAVSQSPASADPEAGVARVSAYALLSSGHYLAAINVLEQAQPKSALLYNQMGIAAEHMYMTAKAEESFKRAIQMDRRSADAYNNLATVYHGEKAYGKAEKCYKQALRLDPTNAIAEKNLGTLYFARKKYRQGELAYRRALALDRNVFAPVGEGAIQVGGDQKNNADFNFHLARLFAQSGESASAMNYLQKAVAGGFHDRRRLLADPAFTAMRGEPDFGILLHNMGG